MARRYHPLTGHRNPHAYAVHVCAIHDSMWGRMRRPNGRVVAAWAGAQDKAKNVAQALVQGWPPKAAEVVRREDRKVLWRCYKAGRELIWEDLRDE